MLKSIESLRENVAAPITRSLGVGARIISLESHGDEVRGLAIHKYKVVRFVFDTQTNSLCTTDLLQVIQ